MVSFRVSDRFTAAVTVVSHCGFTPTGRYTKILNRPTFRTWLSAIMFAAGQLMGLVVSPFHDDQTVELLPIGVSRNR